MFFEGNYVASSILLTPKNVSHAKCKNKCSDLFLNEHEAQGSDIPSFCIVVYTMKWKSHSPSEKNIETHQKQCKPKEILLA